MATTTTSLYDAQKFARTNPARIPNANSASGPVHVACIPYTLLGTEAANDVIKLGILPAGVVPIPQLSKVTSADPGTTLTLDVGVAADPDGWADGITLSAGGQIEFTSGTAPAFMTAPAALDGDSSNGNPGSAGNVEVLATVASANTLTAGVVLYFLLAYKIGS